LIQDADFGLPGKEEYREEKCREEEFRKKEYRKEYRITRYLFRYHDTAKR